MMMAIAALLATTSSVNATLYASGGADRMLAEVGQFPPLFGRRTRGGAHVGLLITAALVLIVANLVDLSAIASVGSAIALAVFVLVALAGYRRRADTGANVVIAIAAIVVSAVVLVFFAVDTLRNDPATFVAIVAIVVLAVVLDALWKRRRANGDRPPSPNTRRPSPHPADMAASSSSVPSDTPAGPQSATPYADAVRAYAGRSFVRLDVPGHGGDAVAQPELADVLGEHVLALDVPPLVAASTKGPGRRRFSARRSSPPKRGARTGRGC